ncbi:hypothetical protein [Hyalangium minutum]|uniref:Uncharacterized protein n=1 Tax=Hyalangium minutum TaxID=394096 RepID=A0A085WKG5_9BACT|nr:hypothetical protein [Hyalangium minutum]KFE68178.1 hypothetical protein DB31_7415 [Hyalangium minutum]
MRSIALLLSLTAAVASAQQPDAPTAPPLPPPSAPMAAPTEPPLPPPPPPPATTVPPAATGPSETPGERVVRYSRFSAGPGGSLVAFTEVMSGIVSGAMLGNSFDTNDSDKSNSAYTGAVVGGLTLGTIATMYQYYVPVERNESLLVAGAATSGFVAGLAISASEDMSSRNAAWLSLATTQLGIVSVLALTKGGADVSTGDASLVGMVSLYALTLTGLTQGIIDGSSSRDVNYTPTFIAPALGMALGGLLAIPLEIEASRVIKLTMVPLGVGASMLFLGSLLAEGTTVPLTALAGIVTSFALTFLLTSDPGMPTERYSMRRSDGFQAVPVPVVMAAGPDNKSVAGGAGLFVRF